MHDHDEDNSFGAPMDPRDSDLIDISPPSATLREYAEGTVQYLQDTVAPNLSAAAKSIVNNPVTRTLGRGAKNALASAAGRNKIRPISPEEINDVLNKYQRSYDLSSYQTYAKQAAGKISTAVNTIPTTLDEHNNRTVDLTKLGTVGKDIKDRISLNIDASLSEDLMNLQAHLGTLQPQGIEGKDGILGKYLALHDEMQQATDKFHTPYQIIAAFDEIKKHALEKLDTGKAEAIKKLRDLIPANDVDLHNLPPEQSSLIKLLGIDTNKPDAHAQLTKKVEELIKHTEKTYDDARNDLNDFFAGKPERKENDKTIPKVTGLDEKLRHEKARVEQDLINRAIQLERMEARGFKISRAGENDLTLSTGEAEESKEDRERALQGLKMADLQGKKWSGYLRDRKLGDIKTRSGGNITYEMVGGKYCATKLKIPARCFFLFESSMIERINLDMEEYIGHVKAQKEPGSPIEITLDHEVDETRREMVLAAYKAARKHGYEPDQITLNVNGSTDEKQQFKKKPALEVLQAMGLGNDDAIKEDLKSFNEKKELIARRHTKHAGRNIAKPIKELRQADDSTTKPEIKKPDDQNEDEDNSQRPGLR